MQKGRPVVSVMGRLCCKSPKSTRDDFSAKRRSKPRSSIGMASSSLARLPVSSSPCDEVPHMFTRKPRLQPGKFLNSGAKRLLQHNRQGTYTGVAGNPGRRAVCQVQGSGAGAGLGDACPIDRCRRPALAACALREGSSPRLHFDDANHVRTLGCRRDLNEHARTVMSGPLPVRTEKLDSDVLVMKPADQVMRHDAANPLNRARDRRIFVQ